MGGESSCRWACEAWNTSECMGKHTHAHARTHARTHTHAHTHTHLHKQTGGWAGGEGPGRACAGLWAACMCKVLHKYTGETCAKCYTNTLGEHVQSVTQTHCVNTSAYMT